MTVEVLPRASCDAASGPVNVNGHKISNGQRQDLITTSIFSSQKPDQHASDLVQVQAQDVETIPF